MQLRRALPKKPDPDSYRERLKRYRLRTRAEMSRRLDVDGWRCDGCGGELDERAEGHHVFGRGRRSTVGEPLASHPALMAALCRSCHREVTDHPMCERQGRLEFKAAVRLRKAMPSIPDTAFRWDERLPEIARMASVERWMQETGMWDEMVAEAGLR